MNLEKTKIRRLSYDKDLLSRTKNLRKIMTEPEKKLWFKFFKPFQQTYNIRVLRQRPINFYIADFYIPSYKTVIELDGESHYTEYGIDYDKERTEVLNGLGLKVIRYTNKEIMENFSGVCEDILKRVLGSNFAYDSPLSAFADIPPHGGRANNPKF